MAWTPPTDAVAEFTPPQDAIEFTPPSDGEVSNTFLEDVGTSLKNAFTSPVDENDSPFMRGVKNPFKTALGGIEVAANVASGIPAMAVAAGNVAYQPINNLLTGKPQTSAEQNYMAGMEASTYQPRTEFGQQVTEKVTAPLMQELLPLAPIMGGLAVPHAPVEFRNIPKIHGERASANIPALPFNERVMAEKALSSMDKDIAATSSEMTKLHEIYSTRGLEVNAENSPLIPMRERLAALKIQREELAKKLEGDVSDQHNTELAIAQGKPKPTELVPPTAEETAMASIPTESLPVELKTSPHEVALTKVGEAMQETPAQAADRIWAVEEKLAKIADTPENSALREALEFERASYEKLANGEKLTDEWLNKVVPEIKAVEAPKLEIVDRVKPTSDEVTQLLVDHKTLGEVLNTLRTEKIGNKSQRVLMALLEKIPHVLTSKFEVSAAQLFDKNGKPATGMYDKGTHTTVLHPGGTVKTILHEAVHAASVAILDHNGTAAARRMTNLYNTINNLYGNELKTNGNPRYGFTNVKEFVSEAFTNPEFQKFLESKASTLLGKEKAKTLWDTFKNVIKDALGKDRETRTALDDVLESGREVMEETARRDERVIQKLSDLSKKDKISFENTEIPSAKPLRGMIGRNWFGMNTLEGFYRDHPVVQKAFKQIKDASDTSESIVNQLWHNTDQVLRKNEPGFFKSLTKIKEESSPLVAVRDTPNTSMANILEVFQKGFEEGKNYADNLATNGQHLTQKEQVVYNTLAKLFKGMYDSVTAVQTGLGKKYVMEERAGWFPARREGNYAVQIDYGGHIAHLETFPTRIAAEAFKRKIGETKILHVSDITDLSKGEIKMPNQVMADTIKDMLAKQFPLAEVQLQAAIDKLTNSMYTRGGKLGKHHEHRLGIPGYKGSELFLDKNEVGKSFKVGIQGEVNNFASNLKTLMIKDKLQKMVEDRNFKETRPVEHAAIEQMYDSALGRNEDFLGHWEERPNDIIDSMANKVMQKALGKAFEGKEKSAAKHVVDTAMRSFYATKMMAKIVFPLAQLLTTPMIIPELAQYNHGIRAFYSFGKGISKLLTRDKDLMEALFKESQEYGTIEPQFRESLNLDKHSNLHSGIEKVVDGLEDYVLLGKLGTMTDSMSRAVSFVTAYTHFKDLGFTPEQSAYKARRVTATAMNTYGTDVSAPIYTKLGVIGEGMKPLTSFAQNQLGNLAKYWMQARKGDFGPLVAAGLIATATGGILGLPFLQEYERARQLLGKFFGTDIPSILDIIYRDESFMDRLQIAEEDRKAVKDYLAYGPLSASTGIDLTSTGRMNETMFSVMGAIAMGQEDALKLMPIIGASVDQVKAVPGLIKAFAGKGTEGEDKKAIDATIVGPLNYTLKKATGTGTTRLMGENTGMLSTGVAGNADIPASTTSNVAAFLGSKTVDQKRIDQQAFEQQARDTNKQAQVQRATTMFDETSKPEYLQQLVELGLTPDKIQAAVKAGAYNKLVDQQVRYFYSSKNRLDQQKFLNLKKTGALQ